MSTVSQTQIGILGAGLIGAAWAALFKHHGAKVVVWDPSQDALDALDARTEVPLAQLAELTGHPATGQIEATQSLEEAVRGAALVQENAPENIALKHELYAQVEELVESTTILASSASGLTWSDLAPALKDPTRLITAHPFNPPHLIPLVELYGPDPATLDRAEEIYQAVGRKPVRLNKGATGHIANRLASALWREAVHIVAEGIADVEAVDAALTNGPGLRWSVQGAHMSYHLGGGSGGLADYLSHLGPSQERRWSTLGTPSLTPELCDTLVSGVLKEADGKSIAELEEIRDAALIATLKLRGNG
ncbi:3-hydroxyacyl-CoA dehydrogenase NAD-binding domain-containing protein [Ruegeria sp.]|uniref:3-hydroxyacyl-CoA dehydrogenase NAD-binding domain-containing protein n=1 Tax=Ruegeria sp. TaxID=1879320 RepID=UPI00231D80B9|nr:3-hydroxyacyl-CoA dehydrogenase NAD-binding domain-containing protein [Ruegeria sp.]MDA7964311.1 3-hydroxyacyl-CoA dehydrogenase NAD-binding domain-containing protein [Ruegeria sp.]